MIRFVFAWPPEPKATGSNPVGRAIPSCGPLAQLAEQQTLNLKVPGSIPGRLTTSFQPLTRISRTRPPRPGVGRLTPRRLPCSVRSRHALSRVYDARVPYFSKRMSDAAQHESGTEYVQAGISILPAGSGPSYTNTPLRTPDFFSARYSAPNSRQVGPRSTGNRLEPLLSGYFSGTAPHVCPVFAASLHSGRASASRHWQRPDPPQHVAEQSPGQMPFRQQEPVVPRMLHQPAPGFH